MQPAGNGKARPKANNAGRTAVESKVCLPRTVKSEHTLGSIQFI